MCPCLYLYCTCLRICTVLAFVSVLHLHLFFGQTMGQQPRGANSQVWCGWLGAFLLILADTRTSPRREYKWKRRPNNFFFSQFPQIISIIVFIRVVPNHVFRFYVGSLESRSIMRLSLPRRGWRYIFQAPHQENVLSAFFHQTFLFTNILESFEFAIFLSLFFRWLWFSIQLRISQRRIFILSTSDINSSMGILSRRKQKNITNLVSSHWATFKSKVNFVEFDERGSFTIDFCQL